MNYNYHTHTFRCHHAGGTMEEYIQKAIEGGIRDMGFSEHAPHICQNGEEARYRLAVSEAEDYISELRELREKYRGAIDIHIGFEMEYYTEQFPRMLARVKSLGGEYLLLGQHFLREELPDGEPGVKPTEDVERLKTYADLLCEAIATGAFSYVAHPDFFNFVGDKEIYLSEMERVCVASKTYGIPLEINFLGIRDHRHYPREDFWQLVGRVGSPVTFGLDAHSAKNGYDHESLAVAMQMVETFGLNYIGAATLRPLI